MEMLMKHIISLSFTILLVIYPSSFHQNRSWTFIQWIFRSKMIKIWVNRHIVFNMKSGESRKSKSMNHHIISVVILNPVTNNIPQTVTF